MKNILPSSIRLQRKYDLKGSTNHRSASLGELAKSSPTLKDLDYLDDNPGGIVLEEDTYTALLKNIESDCQVWVFVINF